MQENVEKENALWEDVQLTEEEEKFAAQYVRVSVEKDSVLLRTAREEMMDLKNVEPCVQEDVNQAKDCSQSVHKQSALDANSVQREYVEETETNLLSTVEDKKLEGARDPAEEDLVKEFVYKKDVQLDISWRADANQ